MIKVVDVSWIKEVEFDEAEGKSREVYERIKKERGKVSNIMKVQSLMPSAMENHLDLYLSIMFEDRSLSRERCEMIGVVVSSMNRCSYCVNHHSEALNHFWRDEEKVKRLGENYGSLDLSKKDLAMLDFAERSTQNPEGIEEKDIEELRKAGFSDEQILNIAMISSYFNFVNRIALTMGVDFSEDEIKGYEY